MMEDRTETLAFQDHRSADLYFCRGDKCDREDRDTRRERCASCLKAASQQTTAATAYRIWKRLKP